MEVFATVIHVHMGKLLKDPTIYNVLQQNFKDSDLQLVCLVSVSVWPSTSP